MLLRLYIILTYLAWPLIYLYLLSRKAKGKEDKDRFTERLGLTKQPRPSGLLLWLHAASVGESLSILSLINRLSQENKTLNILVTTGTVTSAAMIKPKLPVGAIHQYVPADVLTYAKRFINHWQPNLALFTESDLWPNLIYQTAKTCPLILLNARMSDESFSNWQRFCSLAQSIMQCFTLILPQSKIDDQRFRALGAKNITYIGNLKYSSPSLPVDHAKLTQLQEMIQNRPVLVAASTHKGEEEQLIATHLELKKQVPTLITIIAPRNVARSQEIAKIIIDNHLLPSIRSAGEVITTATDIYLADTMGELGILYSLADVAFIGGSLTPQGGHNPIEAAHFNAAIVMGPFVFNCRQITAEFLEQEAMIIAKDQEDLANIVLNLFQDEPKRKQMAKSGKEFVENANDIIGQTTASIIGYLPEGADK